MSVLAPKKLHQKDLSMGFSTRKENCLFRVVEKFNGRLGVVLYQSSRLSLASRYFFNIAQQYPNRTFVLVDFFPPLPGQGGIRSKSKSNDLDFNDFKSGRTKQ